MPITQEALTRLSRRIGLFFRVIGLGRDVIGAAQPWPILYVCVILFAINQTHSVTSAWNLYQCLPATGYEPVTRPGINLETTEARSYLLTNIGVYYHNLFY